jgi:hypothetical protein
MLVEELEQLGPLGKALLAREDQVVTERVVDCPLELGRDLPPDSWRLPAVRSD